MEEQKRETERSPESEQTYEEEPSESMVQQQKQNQAIRKRKTRRGRRRILQNKVCKKFNLYLCNIRAVRSKLVLLKDIVNKPDVDPEVVALVETNL